LFDGSKRCSCGAGCPSFGNCLRSKRLNVGYCRSAAGWDATREKKWDRELNAYRSARAEGIQPDGTTMSKIDKARELSDQTGTAYGA
jgi:hypothetical protein